ncbi:MAG: NurA domain-containing protein [Deltaproteobacteria bacterium]|nr:NurA domain-containing protein [Deltaproteobacteria bacterium]
MGYVSKRKRPNEYASKSSHVYVINSPSVRNFLARCDLPKRADEVSLDNYLIQSLEPTDDNPIRHIIAIDGGYSEVPVQVEFPSSTIAFFQFGALTFNIRDLEELDEQPFIDPDDMTKLKQIQRLELVLPIRNVALKDEVTLTSSVRRAMYEFFRNGLDDGLATLKWLIFQEYDRALDQWNLANCPHCNERNVPLKRNRMSKEYTFECMFCNKEIFLTDVFRLHEAIDDDVGAGGILGYVTVTVEQVILAHLIRLILKMRPVLLDEILFIKDGPLAFFGQTANVHKPMRELVKFLFDRHNLHLAGLEKSGPFVEHADEIAQRLGLGEFLILSDEYIYKYIIPGRANPNNPYGCTTYYGNKIIFRSSDDRTYVITLPTTEVLTNPTVHDFRNLDVILSNIQKLRCDMYDDALFPVALVNKLVSLADHPSTRILQRFAVDTMHVHPG